jgi:carotenoid cleavage dioxygenase-like enzyme
MCADVPLMLVNSQSGPTFVPRPQGNSEDDGYLLVTVLDGGKDGQPRTRLDVFDAIAVNKGPVCSVALESYLPHTLYGYST